MSKEDKILDYIRQNGSISSQKAADMCMIRIFINRVTLSMKSQKDDTPEIVNFSIETDTLYQYQPYTQIPYD